MWPLRVLGYSQTHVCIHRMSTATAAATSTTLATDMPSLTRLVFLAAAVAIDILCMQTWVCLQPSTF